MSGTFETCGLVFGFKSVIILLKSLASAQNAALVSIALSAKNSFSLSVAASMNDSNSLKV